MDGERYSENLRTHPDAAPASFSLPFRQAILRVSVLECTLPRDETPQIVHTC